MSSSSNFMYDIGSVYATKNVVKPEHNKRETSVDLDMTDFLTLMVKQLQSQTIDDTADTSDMLNQLVQMQMVTSMKNMTDSSLMSYAGSLVGKEVTVGSYNASGKLDEKVVQITGAGVSNGEYVVFAGDETYSLSDIMSVGRLPEIKEEEGEGEKDKTQSGGSVDSTEGSGSANDEGVTGVVDNPNGTAGDVGEDSTSEPESNGGVEGTQGVADGSNSGA